VQNLSVPILDPNELTQFLIIYADNWLFTPASVSTVKIDIICPAHN